MTQKKVRIALVVGFGQNGLRTHQRRKLSPLVLMISMLMILASFLAVVALPASAIIVPDGIPCPGNVGRYVPNCIVFTSSVSYTGTNATVSFELLSVDAYVSLVWGNTTNYGFWAIKNVHYDNGVWYSAFLDYLQPSTTYYFKLTGNQSGEVMGTRTSQWTTQSDHNYMLNYGIVMMGTV